MDGVGVVGRMATEGEDGDCGRPSCAAGDSGRRNGEVRGKPKESGDGLYVEGVAWQKFSAITSVRLFNTYHHESCERSSLF